MLTASISPDLRNELGLLVRSRYPLVVIEGVDESKIRDLVQQVSIDLSLTFLEWSSTEGLRRTGVGTIPDSQTPEQGLDRLLDMEVDVLALMQDLQPYIERPEIVRRLRETETRLAGRDASIVLSGVKVDLPAELEPLAARLEISLPDEAELRRIVRVTARELEVQRRSQIELERSDVDQFAQALRGLHVHEARRVLYQAALDDGRLAPDDLPLLRQSKQRRLEQGSFLEWIEPLGGMEALGGSPNLKRWASRRREAFSEAARLFGLDAPKGLLLVGVPGTGKSLACRALAGEWELPLLRLDPGKLYDKYVGQTESNLRRALSAAEAMAPAVLWMDEIEKALGSSDSGGDAGLSMRILGTLLTWMQDRPAPVFLMATSNDVSKLPMELLRRGRFDEVFFVDLPDAEEREHIFRIHLEKRDRDPSRYDLTALSELTEGFSGAEIEGVIVAALYQAFSERQELSAEVLAAEIEATRPLAQLRPHDIAKLRAWGQDHAVHA